MQLDALLWVFLIVDLGHDDFRRREAASAALATRGLLVAPLLDSASRDPDPEIARRAERLLTTCRQQWANQALPTGATRLPWLDMVPGITPPEAHSWATQARIDGAGPPGSPEWPEYRAATRLWLRDQAAAGVSLAELQLLLDAGRDKEAEWRRKIPRGQ